jgi:hypothetical protein
MSKNFISTGIANDISSERGFDFLRKTGPYSEIISGLTSHNIDSIYYSNGIARTPSIRIYYEHYDSELMGFNIDNVRNIQRLLKSVSGMNDIQEFYSIMKNSNAEDIIEIFKADFVN